MKILRLTLVLNLMFLKTFGQGYFPFVDTNSVWRDLKVDCLHGPSYLYDARFDGEYFLKGDTVIGKSYSKLYFTGKRYFNLYDHGTTANDSNFYCNLYVGGLREDSLKHVYHRDTLGFERELFNFDLAVGDTIAGTVTPGPPYTYVTSVDSVYIFDRYRKRINFNWDVPLIEGIGRGYGILGQNRTTSANWLCPYDRTKLYFYKNANAYRFNHTGHPEDSLATLMDCSVFVGIHAMSGYSNIKAYPNPASDFMLVEFPGNYQGDGMQLTITDNIGRIVLKQNIHKGMIKVDLTSLSEGVYFLKLPASIEKEPVIKIVKIKSQ